MKHGKVITVEACFFALEEAEDCDSKEAAESDETDRSFPRRLFTDVGDILLLLPVAGEGTGDGRCKGLSARRRQRNSNKVHARASPRCEGWSLID